MGLSLCLQTNQLVTLLIDREDRGLSAWTGEAREALLHPQPARQGGADQRAWPLTDDRIAELLEFLLGAAGERIAIDAETPPVVGEDQHTVGRQQPGKPVAAIASGSTVKLPVSVASSRRTAGLPLSTITRGRMPAAASPTSIASRVRDPAG